MTIAVDFDGTIVEHKYPPASSDSLERTRRTTP